MRVIVDEAMPLQVLDPLRLNKGHSFAHVDQLNWKGKRDSSLFADAAAKGYEAVLTLDLSQLESSEECRALRRAGLHHVGIQQGRSAQGVRGIARVLASLVVGMPYVLQDLQVATGQRIVEISLLGAKSRHEIYDPERDASRFPYWH